MKPRQPEVIGSCVYHGHFFGDACGECIDAVVQAADMREKGKMRKLRHRALQEREPVEAAALPRQPAQLELPGTAAVVGGRVMPAQKPGRSRQDYPTPMAFIQAVEQRWGKLTWDLAASAENARAPKFFTAEQNSLRKKWRSLDGNLWLNPPFTKIENWAAKCAYSLEGRRFDNLFLLVPASVGANWFIDHCYRRARVIFLKGRLTFEGMNAPYPKDLILVCYGHEHVGFEVWDYKTGLSQ